MVVDIVVSAEGSYAKLFVHKGKRRRQHLLSISLCINVSTVGSNFSILSVVKHELDGYFQDISNEYNIIIESILNLKIFKQRFRE